jgi:hypothetical protein
MNVSIRCVVLFLSSIAALQAAPFENLNFESAQIASAPANYTPGDAFDPISAASALPFWTAEEDNTVCTAIWGQPNALDETSVALVNPTSSSQFGGVIQGKYSVVLTAMPEAPPGYFQTASIFQTGDVPLQAKSLTFLMQGAYGPAPIVTLGGTPINLVALSQNGTVSTMAGDVSAFAGQTLELKFLCQGVSGASPVGESGFELDNVNFSPVAIPEPSPYAAMIAGTALLGALILRKRQKQPVVNQLSS